MKKYLFVLFAVVFMVAAQAVSAQIYSIESPQLPPAIEQIVEDVQPVYTVTVTVVDIFGNVVETPTTTAVQVGQPIEIPMSENTRKPSIFETMPARDVEYTVIYIPSIGMLLLFFCIFCMLRSIFLCLLVLIRFLLVFLVL